jgi:hypothetical protein
MRLNGHIINAATGKNDVFDGYVVELRHLTRVEGEDEPTFRESVARFTCANKSNVFWFELGDLQNLALENEAYVEVVTPSGKKAVSRGILLVELIRADKPLELSIRAIEEVIAGTPVVARGILKWKADPARTDGFDGFRILATFDVRDPALEPETFVARAATMTLAGSNRFSLSLPDREAMKDGPVDIAVKHPDGVVATHGSFSLDQLREELTFVIDAQQVVVVRSDSRANDAQPQRLKGRVVDSEGKIPIKHRQVILWGKRPGGNLRPLFVVLTDSTGNFAGDWPKDSFEGAIATVASTAQATVQTGVAIELTDLTGREPVLGKLPKFVYIVVSTTGQADAPAEDDCACESLTPRQPDADDLVTNATAYSQDIGLNCVNFTKPNRTLEEFAYTLVVRTTDPEIKGTTLADLERRSERGRSYIDGVIREQATVDKSRLGTPAAAAAVTTGASQIPNLKAALTLESAKMASALLDSIHWRDRFKTVPGRGELTVDNSVDWDGTPTFYQATTIAHGHILHYKQTWKADGYSMGDLLYSLPLAPGQKKQVVIFDWDRTEYGRRDEDTHEDEALSSYLSHNRDITDITNGSLSEHTSGGSQSRVSGSSGGVGGGVGALLGPVMIGVAGGFSTSSGSAASSAWQSSSRNVAATGLNQLRDMIQQGASAVRNQRSTVVQTARQTERFKVETEVIANHNHCHAITVQYFEVLRHYAIEQTLTHVQECLFIPLLMSSFDVAKVMRWRDVLRATLLLSARRRPVGLLGEHPLVRGLDAAERIFMAYEGSDFPTGSYAAESLESLSGELRISFRLNRPLDDDDNAQDPARQEQLIASSVLNVPGWGVWWGLGLSQAQFFATYFANQKVKYKNKIFEERVAPVLAEELIDKLIFTAVSTTGARYPLEMDTTLVSTYQRETELYVTVRPTQAVNVRRDQIDFIEISTSTDISASANSKIIVHSATLRYATAHMNGYLARDYRVDNDLKPNDTVVIYTPLSVEEKRNPRQEDKHFSGLLLEHLNGHLEHYHKAIWQRMDPDRRYMLLDGFIAPGTSGKSVASVVENRVIGVAGNCLIMPVAPGYKLDPTFEYQPQLGADGLPVRDEAGNVVYEDIDLLDHYQPMTPVPPFRVSVPTRGVFAEAVMGSCNSCEKWDESRYWKWEEHPVPDQPTAIAPVQTQPPQRTDPGELKSTPFPTPMINIQNAPPAPEPGATLAGALGVLGKADLFRDITGLDNTQKSALQAMLSNQEAAKHFTDTAAQLALQAANVKSGNTTIESIKKSMADGTLDQATGKKLVEDTYRAQIGGKTSSDASANTASTSELGKAAAQSVKEGNAVKATQTHPDGTSTSVDQASQVSKPGTGTGPRLSFAIDEDAATGGGAIHAPNVSAAVAAFKALFVANPALLKNGQFQITSAVRGRVAAVVHEELVAKPNATLQGIWDNMLRNQNGLTFESKALLDKVNELGLQADYPSTVKAYQPDPTATKAWAQNLYQQVWGNDAMNPTPSVDPPTLARAKAAFELGGVDLAGTPTGEKGACFDSTKALGRKVIKARALPAVPANLKIAQGQIANAQAVSKNATEGFDIVTYGSPAGLAAVVEKMKRALDAGFLLLCGVLSGTRHDMTPKPTAAKPLPQPEHYVLVFAYDNNVFAFWDSDSAVTDIGFTGWGPGFGFLVATNTSLSTAMDPNDLVDVDSGGNHNQFKKRHRYQVYSVQTLPL